MICAATLKVFKRNGFALCYFLHSPHCSRISVAELKDVCFQFHFRQSVDPSPISWNKICKFQNQQQFQPIKTAWLLLTQMKGVHAWETIKCLTSTAQLKYHHVHSCRTDDQRMSLWLIIFLFISAKATENTKAFSSDRFAYMSISFSCFSAKKKKKALHEPNTSPPFLKEAGNCECKHTLCYAWLHTSEKQGWISQEIKAARCFR